MTEYDDDLKEEAIAKAVEEVVDSGWLGRYWIPAFMGMVLLILFLYYIILPILGLFIHVKELGLPQGFWNLALIIVPAHMITSNMDKHLPKVIDKLKK